MVTKLKVKSTYFITGIANFIESRAYEFQVCLLFLKYGLHFDAQSERFFFFTLGRNNMDHQQPNHNTSNHLSHFISPIRLRTILSSESVSPREQFHGGLSTPFSLPG